MPNLYGALDLQKNELRQAQVQNLASSPANPVTGQLYYNTADSTLYFCTVGGGSPTWVAAKAAAGTAAATTVTTQAIGDAPTVGVATAFAREDHKHGMPAFGAITAQTSYGAASGNGAAATLARSDHTHGTPSLTAVTPSTQAIGDAAAVGSGTAPAREDHKHAMPAFGASTATTTFGLSKTDGAAVSLARSDHTHGTPTHDAAAHSAISLSSLAVPTADLSIGGFKLTNVATPIASTDGANKGYIDSAVAGLTWKTTVRVASTAQVALTGLTAIDGVTPAANDRVLLKNQTAPAENGIYTAASGAWTRATDADTAPELVNAAVFVSEGTTQADTAWTQTTNAPITLGTTALTWAQFVGAGSPPTGAAGGDLTGTYPNPTIGTGKVTSSHLLDGTITDTDVNAANKDGVAGTASMRTLGTGAQQAAAGSHGHVLTGAEVTGTLPVSKGGTNATTAIAGGIVYGASTSALATGAAGTAGYFLTSGGASAPTWTDPASIAPPANMAKKYAGALTGTASPETITHNLNTRDIQLSVLNGASPYTAVEVDWDATTVNTAVIRYSPNLGAGYRVVVVG